MSAHTPGPWSAIAWSCHAPTTVVACSTEADGVERKSDKTHVIADCNLLFPDKEREANARLIAAAPEMADLILRTYSHVSHGGPTRAEAEAVLRKAGLL